MPADFLKRGFMLPIALAPSRSDNNPGDKMHKPTTHALYVLPAFFQRKTFIALAIASTLSACGGCEDR